MKITIQVGGKTLNATLEDNATTRAIAAKFPLKIRLKNLYGREMCYRFPEALPANEARESGYKVGEIAYWTPWHSFVIFYKQNGEVIDNLQPLGHVDGSVDMFDGAGDMDATFDMAK